MVHLSEGHLDSDVLTEGNQSDANDGSDLMDGVLLVFFMLSAQVKHVLDLKDVS
jgi:hypothetical protein